MQQRTKRAALAASVLSAALIAVPLGSGSVAVAGVTAPRGDIGDFKQSFVEDFSTDASANGGFAKTYDGSWQPYPDAGIYSSGSQISAHDGLMDVKLDGSNGAAGTFGTPDGAWSHVGGKFTVKAKASGGDGNGAAFMLWPTSNTWADGEIDYPEGNFDASPTGYHHSMTPGQEANRATIGTGVDWRKWHTYSVEWIPGKSVAYLLDGKVLQKVTDDVPTKPHRYMFQVGNWGASGHLFVDWVSTYDYEG